MASGIIPKNVTVDESNFKTYDSLADLGLATNGTVTIQQAVDALVARQPAALFCRSGEFDSDEVPNIYGEIRIVSLASNRTTIDFKGQTVGVGDYRMFLNGQSPAAVTGTWIKIRNAKDSEMIVYSSIQSLGFSSQEPDVVSLWNAMPNGSILICAAYDLDPNSVPNRSGLIKIIKNTVGTNGEIGFYSRTGAGNYYMYLTSSDGGYVPSGTWTLQKNSLNFLAKQYESGSETVSAATRKVISFTIPDMDSSDETMGFRRVGIVGFQVGGGTANAGNFVSIDRISAIPFKAQTTVNVTVYNRHSSSLTFKVIINVACIKLS